MPWTQIFAGLVLSTAIGGIGYWRGSLSPGGVAGAVVIGTLTFGLGGWSWGLLVVVFFVSSSLLSRFRSDRKKHLAEKFSKGGRRDWDQTMANGSVAALLAVGHFLTSAPWLWAAFVGAVATVTADTWATEMGVLGSGRPRLLTTWKRVPVGTSGAISLPGTLASLTGAWLIGVSAWLFGLVGDSNYFGLLGSSMIAGIGGLGGSLFDSLLGATVQAVYYCGQCGKETEQTTHRCGASTRQIRGWRWLNNDWVNFLSSVAGGSLAACLAGAFWAMSRM